MRPCSAACLRPAAASSPFDSSLSSSAPQAVGRRTVGPSQAVCGFRRSLGPADWPRSGPRTPGGHKSRSACGSQPTGPVYPRAAEGPDPGPRRAIVSTPPPGRPIAATAAAIIICRTANRTRGGLHGRGLNGIARQVSSIVRDEQGKEFSLAGSRSPHATSEHGLHPHYDLFNREDLTRTPPSRTLSPARVSHAGNRNVRSGK